MLTDLHPEYVGRGHFDNYPFHKWSGRAARSVGRTPRRYNEADLIYRFTRGQCWHFARALNSLTGWPLVALSDYRDEPDHYGCFHGLCLNADGYLVDIEGARFYGDVLEEYGAESWHIVTRDWFGKIRPDCCNYAETYARRYILKNKTFFGIDRRVKSA